MAFKMLFYEMLLFGIYMVNIIFARAVYLMHILDIKPVNFIGRFHYMLGVFYVYKRPCFGQFQ